MGKKEQLKDFIKHVEAWKRNTKEYVKWVDRETKKRMGKYDSIQNKTRSKMIKNVDGLNFDKQGRSKSTSISDQSKITKFRRNTDKDIGKMVKDGKKAFGITAIIDSNIGLSIGDMDSKLKKQARKNLTDMHDGIENSIQNSETQEFRGLEDDFEVFIEDMDELLGEHGRKLAENIGANLGISARPTRNKLEEAPRQRKTKAQISDETKIELTKKQKGNVKASFDVHLKSLAREAADKYAKQIKAKKFMGFDAKTDQIDTMNFGEYRDENLATIGPQPNSNKFAIPVPPESSSIADETVRIVKLSGKARQEAIDKAFD